jgi:hypothetical protein
MSWKAVCLACTLMTCLTAIACSFIASRRPQTPEPPPEKQAAYELHAVRDDLLIRFNKFTGETKGVAPNSPGR